MHLLVFIMQGEWEPYLHLDFYFSTRLIYSVKGISESDYRAGGLPHGWETWIGSAWVLRFGCFAAWTTANGMSKQLDKWYTRCVKYTIVTSKCHHNSLLHSIFTCQWSYSLVLFIYSPYHFVLLPQKDWREGESGGGGQVVRRWCHQQKKRKCINIFVFWTFALAGGISNEEAILSMSTTFR